MYNARMIHRPRLRSGSEVPEKSGRGQPHSKTLARRIARHSFREVLECGCPLPLSSLRARGLVLMLLNYFAPSPGPWTLGNEDPLEFELWSFSGYWSL